MLKKLTAKRIITAIFLILLALGFFYSADRKKISEINKIEKNVGEQANVANEEKVVTKIIDGDTIVVEGGISVRLLGIDADEKGYPCFEVAKKRLEDLVLSKNVFLEKGEKDKDVYGRELRYVFLGQDNINLRMVREGLAVAFFYQENKKYRDEINQAEAEAKDTKTGCKWNK